MEHSFQSQKDSALLFSSLESGLHSVLSTLKVSFRSDEALITPFFSRSLAVQQVVKQHGYRIKIVKTTLEELREFEQTVIRMITAKTKLVIVDHLCLPFLHKATFEDLNVLVIGECGRPVDIKASTADIQIFGDNYVPTNVGLLNNDGVLFHFRDQEIWKQVKRITDCHQVQSDTVYSTLQYLLQACILALRGCGRFEFSVMRCFIAICELIPLKVYSVVSKSRPLEFQPSASVRKLTEKSSQCSSKLMYRVQENKKLLVPIFSNHKHAQILSEWSDGYCSFMPVVLKCKHAKQIVSSMRRFGYDIRLHAHSTQVMYIPLTAFSTKQFQSMVTSLSKLVNCNKTQSSQYQKKALLTFQVVLLLCISWLLKHIWFYLLFTFLVCYFLLCPSTADFHTKPYTGIKQKRVKHIRSDSTPLSVIVTGASGFVGSTLVRDLLNTYGSDEIRMYLILRGKKSLGIKERVRKIFGNELLDKRNVNFIDAELTNMNLEDVVQQIQRNQKEPITHVIHSAATVKFTDTHLEVAKINITATLQLKKLADLLNAKFVYISTAFVQVLNNQRKKHYLNTDTVQLAGDVTPQQLYELMLENDHFIDYYMKRYHIENNYILSKQIAENIIGSTSIIVRPSVIGPAWNFPYPGYYGSYPSTISMIITGLAGGLLRLPCRANLQTRATSNFPVVPIDFVTETVVNALSETHCKILLAALNTTSKYTHFPSSWNMAVQVVSYFFSMELKTGVECVIIKLALILSSLSKRWFRALTYILNKLPAPKKYQSVLKTVQAFECFTFCDFNVQDGITPHHTFDGVKYLDLMCEAAANAVKKPVNDLRSSSILATLKLTENLFISAANVFCSVILKKTTSKVAVSGMERLFATEDKNRIIVLAPTHRSFYDFILICKLCVKYQMYGLSMPFSFATSKFKQSRTIAGAMRYLRAFFIENTANNANKVCTARKRRKLKEQITEIIEGGKNSGKTTAFQLFVEGTRSRDRSFLQAKHGALSCLAELSDLQIIPITINYEKIPEQATFNEELLGGQTEFSLFTLLQWFYNALVKNTVQLGNINIQIGASLQVEKQTSYSKNFYTKLTDDIQSSQMKMVNVTNYHIQHWISHGIQSILSEKHCQILAAAVENETRGNKYSDAKELYMISTQFMHYLEPNSKLFSLIQSMKPVAASRMKNEKVDRILVHDESLGYWGYTDSYFTLDTEKTHQVCLKGNRYEISNQQFEATVPFLSKLSGIPLIERQTHLPVILQPLATSEYVNNNETHAFLCSVFGESAVSTDIATRYRHGTGHAISDMLHLRFASECSELRVPHYVVYPKKREMIQKLVQFANSTKSIAIIPFGGGTNVTHSLWCPEAETRQIVSVDMSHMNKLLWIDQENQTAKFEAGIKGKELELTLKEFGYTSGHYPDSYEFSTLGGWIATYASGMKQNKYGNIEQVVIDFEVITCATVNEHTYTLAVSGINTVNGRVSSGSNYLSAFFGSEGNLGIITSAVIRIHKLAKKVKYDSLLFKNWNDGIRLIKMLKTAVPKNYRPASFRLVDNTQFRLSQTFKSKENENMLINSLTKLNVTQYRGFTTTEMCAATIVYEGSTAAEVQAQESMLTSVIKQSNVDCIRGGSSSGKAGFNLTFAIAYLRDFMLSNFSILAESFETFVPWTHLMSEYKEQLQESISQKHKQMNLEGNPFLSFRISQIYNEGVCLYLYYGFYLNLADEENKKRALGVFGEMENFIKLKMMELGGSISHHHGVGKLRSHILKKHVAAGEYQTVAKSIKHAFDPNNVFCANNALC